MANDKQIIFSMVGVSKMVPPQKHILKNIYLSFYYGAKIGVLGLNGAGKSTLLRIIAGIEKDYSGEVIPSKNYTIGFLEQEPKLDPEKTVLECVKEAVKDVFDLLQKFEDISNKFSDPDADMDKLMEEQAKLQEKLDAVDAWNIENKLKVAMDALRCPPEDQKTAHLSGGEKRRIALCKLLLQEPDILLLDEPTNHLDAESVHWLERHLQEYKGTIIAVTHDRYFLDNAAEWILELDRGEGIPWKGNYSSWLEQKEKRMQLEEKKETKRSKTLERELEWIRMSPKARQSKGKARLNAYEQMLSEETAQKVDEVEIFIPSGPRLGDLVIEATGVAKAYGEKLLFDNLNFKLPKNGIVGVIGPNGAGKTTLFKLITGKETADNGSFKVGDTVKLAYVDQERNILDPNKQVWETISDGAEIIKLKNRDITARAYAAKFNFSGADQQKIVKHLSGGERNRVHLARLLKEGANVILLDEPTNDLDVNTLRALEEALENFAGCAVVISHDRWFLDRIATHILAFEGDSQVVYFEGNFSDYEADKKRRLGVKADQPHRIQYRKFKL